MAWFNPLQDARCYSDAQLCMATFWDTAALQLHIWVPYFSLLYRAQSNVINSTKEMQMTTRILDTITSWWSFHALCNLHIKHYDKSSACGVFFFILIQHSSLSMYCIPYTVCIYTIHERIWPYPLGRKPHQLVTHLKSPTLQFQASSKDECTKPTTYAQMKSIDPGRRLQLDLLSKFVQGQCHVRPTDHVDQTLLCKVFTGKPVSNV